MAVPYETSASLSALMYELSGEKGLTGMTLQQVMDSDLLGQEYCDIIEANGLQNAKILDTSWNYGDTYGTMNAATFEIDGSVYVAYRGTGDGNWKYNADSAYGNGPSEMQDWALEYFDHTMENCGDGNVYVTGHSQGGNNAMYVTYASEHGDRITNCIAVDGPGFNQETIDQIKAEHGEDYYEAQRQKSYAVNGENDYVHGLGEVQTVPPENTFTIATEATGGTGVDGHSITTHFTDGKFNLEYDENGYPVSVSESEMSLLIAELNASLLKNFSDEERHEYAVALMALIEFAIGDNDPENLSDLSGIVDTVQDLVPLITKEALEDPETFWGLVEQLGVDEKVTSWFVENPIVAAAVVVTVAVVAFVFLDNLEELAVVIEKVIAIVQAVGELVQHIKDFVVECMQTIKNAIEKIREFLYSHSPGVKYAAANPQFKVDTALLRSYAARIDAVNRRLSALDRDLNSVLWQVGLFGIGTILAVDALTSWSPTLRLAQNYLNDTADRMENAENQALGYMGG